MPDVVNDLLVDPSFTVRRAGDERVVSLPAVLAALQQGAVDSFPALQAHQAHAWYAFLVQLAAIAYHRAGGDRAPVGEDEWRKCLLRLSAGCREAWSLVVRELSLPAFLQPPVPERSLAGFKRVHRCPDEIDVLVTSKNHDVKGARIHCPRAEHWAFALVSLQTMQGYLGVGNYGIARMNGGFSSRPCVTLAPASGLDLGARFSRDTAALLSIRSKLVDDYGYRADDGHALLWLEPWDGEAQFGLDSCDPFFIEICRRMRMEEGAAGPRCLFAPSKSMRLAAGESKGLTGDPWTPVKQDGAALTVSGAGFSYKLLQELLFSGDYRPGATLAVQPGDPKEMTLVSSVLVRGQGETQGLHERSLPLPGAARLRLARNEGRQQVAKLAKRRIEMAGEVQHRVLKPAVCALLQAGADDLDFRDERSKRWIEAHDARVDEAFFEELWKGLDQSPEVAEHSWSALLVAYAEQVLEEAIRSTPLAGARRYRAIAVAENRFRAARQKYLPKETSDERCDGSVAGV